MVSRNLGSQSQKSDTQELQAGICEELWAQQAAKCLNTHP